MRSLLAAGLVVAIALGGCGFAVKHPAVTAGIVGGSMGLVTCELSVDDHKACLAVGAGAAALLGLVAAAALWLGSTGEDSVLQPPSELSPQLLRPAQARPVRPKLDPMPKPVAPVIIPDYLKERPELFARNGTAIGAAPAVDQAVAATYAASSIRGPLHNGQRITILTERTKYKVGEEVRVIHVHEAPEPGHTLGVMGPKSIHGEYVDGVERTPPLGVQTYDGRVLESPGVDFNYEVTTYTFTTPGPHRIQWRSGTLESNVIEIDVAAP